MLLLSLEMDLSSPRSGERDPVIKQSAHLTCISMRETVLISRIGQSAESFNPRTTNRTSIVSGIYDAFGF